MSDCGCISEYALTTDTHRLNDANCKYAALAEAVRLAPHSEYCELNEVEPAECDCWKARVMAIVEGTMTQKHEIIEGLLLSERQASDEFEAANAKLSQTIAELRREVANELHDVDMLCRHLTTVYMYLSGDIVSKPTTLPEVVITLFEDRLTQERDEEVSNLQAKLKVAVEALKMCKSRADELPCHDAFSAMVARDLGRITGVALAQIERLKGGVE